MDSALDDFLKRFGDPTKDRDKVQTVSQMKASGLSNISLNDKIEIPDASKVLSTSNNDVPDMTENLPQENSFGNKLQKGLTTALDMAPDAMSLLSNAKGDLFDTSAEGSGPGKARGAIIKGVSDGASLGSKFGPWGAGIGAVTGGLLSTFAHKKAMKEWRENQKKENLKQDAIKKEQREEQYRMEEGMESLRALKNLREKQFGLIS